MNKQKIDYTCKFCKKPGSLVAEMPDCTAIGITLNLWIENLCCDPCGKYHKARLKLNDKIAAVCRHLISSRAIEHKELRKIEVACEEKLIKITHQYMKLVCEYYGFEKFHDDSFPALLMEKPHMVSKIINQCVRGIAKMRATN